jgi:hypothetical protein
MLLENRESDMVQAKVQAIESMAVANLNCSLLKRGKRVSRMKG